MSSREKLRTIFKCETDSNVSEILIQDNKENKMYIDIYCQELIKTEMEYQLKFLEDLIIYMDRNANNLDALTHHNYIKLIKDVEKDHKFRLHELQVAIAKKYYNYNKIVTKQENNAVDITELVKLLDTNEPIEQNMLELIKVQEDVLLNLRKQIDQNPQQAELLSYKIVNLEKKIQQKLNDLRNNARSKIIDRIIIASIETETSNDIDLINFNEHVIKNVLDILVKNRKRLEELERKQNNELKRTRSKKRNDIKQKHNAELINLNAANSRELFLGYNDLKSKFKIKNFFPLPFDNRTSKDKELKKLWSQSNTRHKIKYVDKIEKEILRELQNAMQGDSPEPQMTVAMESLEWYGLIKSLQKWEVSRKDGK